MEGNANHGREYWQQWSLSSWTHDRDSDIPGVKNDLVAIKIVGKILR